MESDWSDKADEAAQSVKYYYLCHSKILPLLYYPVNTRWDRETDSRWYNLRRLFPLENYWWCAHFIDCMIDQTIRTGKQADRKLIHRLIWTLFIRNGGTVVNDYYDDMAWFGLALQRAERNVFLHFPRMLSVIRAQLQQAWSPRYGGGEKWWKQDYYFNAPTNGTAGIFALYGGDIVQAHRISEWMNAQLYDPISGLIFDGIHSHVHADHSYTLHDLESTIYTYNQGLVAALEWGLFLRGWTKVHDYDRLDLVARILDGIRRELCTTDLIVRGQGVGDAGLFPGILLRFLAEIVCTAQSTFPVNCGEGAMSTEVRVIMELAQAIVTNSAEALYQGAYRDAHGLRFSPDWSQPADMDDSSDLSVQLGAWMALEAAVRIERSSTRH